MTEPEEAKVKQLVGKTAVVPFFLMPGDEAAFHRDLVTRYPMMRIVDGDRWQSAVPPLAASFSECTSRYPYLWPANEVQQLPVVARGAEFDGPKSGMVMQLMRSRLVDGVLLSGQIGAGYSEKNAWMGELSRGVFNVLRRMTVAKLHPVGKPNEVTGTYVVGPDAAEFARQGGRLMHTLGRIEYELAR